MHVETERQFHLPGTQPHIHNPLPPPRQGISRKVYLEINGVLKSAAFGGEHSSLETLTIPCPRPRKSCAYVNWMGARITSVPPAVRIDRYARVETASAPLAVRMG